MSSGSWVHSWGGGPQNGLQQQREPWDTQDEVGDILVKKALRIIAIEDYQKGWRFFAFRPWMSFQDDPESLQTINSSHIIVTTNPTANIIKHYKACLKGIVHDLKLNKSGKRK